MNEANSHSSEMAVLDLEGGDAIKKLDLSRAQQSSSGAVPDIKSLGSSQYAGSNGANHNPALGRSILSSSRAGAAPEANLNASNDIAKKLKRDSVAGSVVMNSQPDSTKSPAKKYSKRPPNIFQNKQIGQFRVICGGCMVIPPSFKMALVSVAITVIPILCQVLIITPRWPIYIIQAKQDMYKKYRDFEDPDKVYAKLPAIQTVHVVLLIISLTSLLVTSFTEPGIIPRNSDDLLEEMPSSYKKMLDRSENLRFFINKKQLIKQQTRGAEKVDDNDEMDEDLEGGSDAQGREVVNTEQKNLDRQRIRHSSSLAHGSIKNLGDDMELNEVVATAGLRGRNMLHTAGQVVASDGNAMSKGDGSSNYGGVSSIQMKQGARLRSDQGAARKEKKEEIVCKKCPTCNILKTPRSFHCSICDCCIAVHDHHCPWTGTCVGQRNHRSFVVFNISTTILALYTIVINVMIIVGTPGVRFDGTDPALWNLQLPAYVMAGYGFVVFLFVGVLSGYSCYNVVTNTTTQEDMRDKYALWGSNPYDQGTCSAGNWLYCWHIQESLIYTNYATSVLPKLSRSLTDPSAALSPKHRGEVVKECLKINNQHIQDTALMQAVEADNFDEISVSQSQQPVNADDLKSLRSAKSKNSFKSEMVINGVVDNDQEHDDAIGISRNAAISQGGKGRRSAGGGSRRKSGAPVVAGIRNYETEKLSREVENEVEMQNTHGQKFLAAERDESYDEDEEEFSDPEDSNVGHAEIISQKSFKSHKSLKNPIHAVSGINALGVSFQGSKSRAENNATSIDIDAVARPLSKRSAKIPEPGGDDVVGEGQSPNNKSYQINGF